MMGWVSQMLVRWSALNIRTYGGISTSSFVIVGTYRRAPCIGIYIPSRCRSLLQGSEVDLRSCTPTWAYVSINLLSTKSRYISPDTSFVNPVTDRPTAAAAVQRRTGPCKCNLVSRCIIYTELQPSTFSWSPSHVQRVYVSTYRHDTSNDMGKVCADCA